MKLSKIKKNPNNPRFIRDVKFNQLVTSILSLPKMMRLREIVLNNKGECESQAGNMRAEALRFISKLSLDELSERINTLSISDERKQESIGIFTRLIETKEIPAEWIKFADDMSEEELREFVIKDNNNFGEWDWDVLANLYPEDFLIDCGLDLPVIQNVEDIDINQFFEEDRREKDSRLSLVLHYPEQELELVKKELLKHGGSFEAAIWQLLGL